MSDGLSSSIRNALIKSGFKPVFLGKSSDKAAFEGSLNTCAGDQKVILSFNGKGEFKPPIIKLVDPLRPFRGCKPHLFQDQLCYIDASRFHLDRHNAGPITHALLKQATHVLNQIANGKYDDDFEREFWSYWKGCNVLSLLPRKSKKGIMVLPTSHQNVDAVIVSKPDDYTRIAPTIKAGRPKSQIPIAAFQIEKPLGIPLGNWPPENLKDFLNWIDQLDETFGREIREALCGSELRNQNEICLALTSRKTRFGVLLNFPIPPKTRYSTKSAKRYRKEYIGKQSHRVKLIRFMIMDGDTKSVVTRNTPGENNLLGLKILVFGCGAIGSTLGDLLLRAGAGVSKTITFVDSDTMGPQNIARHRLGYESIKKWKSDAIKDELLRHFPDRQIESFAGDGTGYNINQEFDVIIDATGDQTFSDYLNSKYLETWPLGKGPLLLFAWIKGAGLAAQSLLVKNSSCYRCQYQVASDGQAAERYPVSADVDAMVTDSCGNSFAPFRGTASVFAAANACDHLLDYLQNPTIENFRTIPLKSGNSIKLPPSTLPKQEDCPACGKHSIAV